MTENISGLGTVTLRGDDADVCTQLHSCNAGIRARQHIHEHICSALSKNGENPVIEPQTGTHMNKRSK